MNSRVTTPINSSKKLPLIALCLGFFMVIIDATIVNVALPSISQNLDADLSGLQWVIDGYTLTFACLLLSVGNLSDRAGAKNVFLWGLVLFVLTSLGCGIATTLAVLIICRILQGMAAALLVPTSLSLINLTYEDNAERAKAIGIWGSIGGIAAAAGPILGAILTSWLGWRAVFFVNIPVGIIAFLLTFKSITNFKHGQKHKFDFAGQTIGIISIAALAFSLIEAGKIGWFSVTVLCGMVIFFTTFILFLIVEQRTTMPMFPLALFKSPTFSAAIAVGMVLNIGFYGVLFLLPLYFHEIKNYSVLLTGLAILPHTCLVAIGSYFSGKFVSRVGPKQPMAMGLLIGALGFLTLFIANDYTVSYLALILPLGAIGFGTAFTMPAATIAIMQVVAPNQIGLASGALNTSRQIGSLIGVAIFGTIIAASTHFTAGMNTTLIIGGLIFLSGFLATVLLVRC